MPLNAERSFILRALAAFAGPQGILDDAFCSSSLSGLDWNSVVNTAQKHRVLPFLAILLQRIGCLQRIPPKARIPMETSLREAALENFSRMTAFRKISGAFQREGIPLAPLKGIALTLSVYEETPARPMGDMDLLVRENDLGRIRKLLEKMDFRFAEGPNRWQAKLSASLIGRWSYVKGDVDIDLQWRPKFFVGPSVAEWDGLQALERALSFRDHGTEVRVLRPQDHMEYLLFQILNDFEMGYLFFLQLLDLGCLAKRHEEIWKQLVSQMLQSWAPPSHPVVGIFTGLIQEVFLERKAWKDLSLKSREILENLFEHPPTKPLAFGGSAFWRLRPSASQKIAFLAGYLFPSKGRSYREHLKRLRGRAKELTDRRT